MDETIGRGRPCSFKITLLVYMKYAGASFITWTFEFDLKIMFNAIKHVKTVHQIYAISGVKRPGGMQTGQQCADLARLHFYCWTRKQVHNGRKCCLVGVLVVIRFSIP